MALLEPVIAVRSETGELDALRHSHEGVQPWSNSWTSWTVARATSHHIRHVVLETAA